MAATAGMASSSSLTNDEIKVRILNVYPQFVTDVDPERLSDYLVQGKVITTNQWQRIRHQNSTDTDRCRALLSHLFYIQHPRAFLVVQKALDKENHYLLETFDYQEPKCGIPVHPEKPPALPERKKTQRLEKNIDDLKKAWNAEKDDLLKVQKELEEKLHLDSTKILVTKNANENSQHKENSPCSAHLGKLTPQVSHEIDYKSDPLLVHTITTKASKVGGEIKGLAILDKELFVVSGKNSKADVYDSMKFNFSHQLSLEELRDPFDVASCKRNKCLYIIDYKDRNESKNILRVDSTGKLIKKWSTEDNYGHLSVTDEFNVILTVSNDVKLNEYSPDGQLIREINLSRISLPDYSYIHHLWHAIKLANGHFVVSHEVDDCHRVSVVDANGELKKSFGGKYIYYDASNGELKKSFVGKYVNEAMNRPIYLSVDRNGFVMVADQLNGRVLLLDSDLKFKREILSKKEHKLRGPSRLLPDELNNRLLVTDCNMENGEDRILIFDFR